MLPVLKYFQRTIYVSMHYKFVEILEVIFVFVRSIFLKQPTELNSPQQREAVSSRSPIQFETMRACPLFFNNVNLLQGNLKYIFSRHHWFD